MAFDAGGREDWLHILDEVDLSLRSGWQFRPGGRRPGEQQTNADESTAQNKHLREGARTRLSLTSAAADPQQNLAAGSLAAQPLPGSAASSRPHAQSTIK